MVSDLPPEGVVARRVCRRFRSFGWCERVGVQCASAVSRSWPASRIGFQGQPRGSRSLSRRPVRTTRPAMLQSRKRRRKNRNVVERAFNQPKNWRRLATRYDKHALVYRGGRVLAAILLWLR
jgi:hypothetical protein